MLGIEVAALSYGVGVKQPRGSKPSPARVLCSPDDSLCVAHERDEDDEGDFAAVSPAPAVRQDSLIFCI